MTRILQFTDLHFRQALPGHSGHSERLSRHGPALLRALRYRVEAEAPDLVAFTGDIIDAPHDLLHNTGDHHDRAAMIEAVKADYLTMRAWLDSLGRPWMIAPGNHDFRPAFLEVFGDVPQKIELPDLTAVSYYDWEVRGNTAERLGDERNRFDAALNYARPDGWNVHLQHFLIWPEVKHGYPMRYREADELHRLLSDAQDRHMVLCGHFHEGTKIVQSGNSYYAVCKSITEAPHCYRVFDFTPFECRMREEHLSCGPLAGLPVILIDRSDITDDPHEIGADFSVRPEARGLFEKALKAGFQPVLVSAWNDPQSLSLLWPEVLKRHDRLYLSLAREGAPQGAGLVIALDESRPLPNKLPYEPLPRYADLSHRIALQYGVEPDMIRFLSSDVSRRERFGAERSGATIEDLISQLRVTV